MNFIPRNQDFITYCSIPKYFVNSSSLVKTLIWRNFCQKLKRCNKEFSSDLPFLTVSEPGQIRFSRKILAHFYHNEKFLLYISVLEYLLNALDYLFWLFNYFMFNYFMMKYLVWPFTTSRRFDCSTTLSRSTCFVCATTLRRSARFCRSTTLRWSTCCGRHIL